MPTPAAFHRIEPEEQRRSLRIAIRLPAFVRQSGKPRSPARLLDLSPHGCRVEIVSSLLPDSWIWVTLSGLEAQYARVVWCHDMFAGLEFEKPLHSAVLDRLLAGVPDVSQQDKDEMLAVARRCEALAERTYGEVASQIVALGRHCAATVQTSGL